MIPVERHVVPPGALLVGVVPHVVELAHVRVDEEVEVLDVPEGAEAEQLQAPVHLVPVLHHVLALPDGVAHQLHRAGVVAAGQDQGVGRLGGRDQALGKSNRKRKMQHYGKMDFVSSDDAVSAVVVAVVKAAFVVPVVIVVVTKNAAVVETSHVHVPISKIPPYANYSPA